MSSFPPPTPPQPAWPEPQGTPLTRFLERHKSVLIALTIIGAFVAFTVSKMVGGDEKESDGLNPLEAQLVVAWNALDGQEQFEICSIVDSAGVDAAANMLQETIGEFSRDAHRDIATFLGTACD